MGLEIWIPGALLGRLFLPKLIESLILEKPDSRSPNLFRRTHLASNTSRIPNTTTATHPSVIPAICALSSCGRLSEEAAGLSVAVPVGDATVVDDEVSVELGPVPVGRLTVDVGVGGVVSDGLLVAVEIAVGTRRGPVPDGMTSVATMVE
jgi:hypothetical protein